MEETNQAFDEGIQHDHGYDETYDRQGSLLFSEHAFASLPI